MTSREVCTSQPITLLNNANLKLLNFSIVFINASIQYFIFPLKSLLSFVGATTKECENKDATTLTS